MIPTYQRILVAHDLTSNADNAFRHAVGLARCHKATVFLVHVVAKIDPSVRSYVTAIMGRGSLEKFEHHNEEEALAELQKDLKEFAHAELGDDPDELKRLGHIEVCIDDPAAGILKAADQHDVDLIVLGSHGKEGVLDYTFLGSVAEKVLRKSRRPVVVVPLVQ